MPHQISLIIPPFTQLNTPYPSISYLTHYLQQHDIKVKQHDFSIHLALNVFSKTGLQAIFDLAEESEELPDQAWDMLSKRETYEQSIDPVIRFLQTGDNTLAWKIYQSSFLPSGPRVIQATDNPITENFTQDQSRYLCTQYLADITDFIKTTIDIGFDFGRYQSQLATGPVSFDPILERLQRTTIIDTWLDELCEEIVDDIVGITIPFPGTLYGALRIGANLKKRGIKVILGGGYINTELRSIQDSRFWNCCDDITLDDGETPLHALIEHHHGSADKRHRTINKDGVHNTHAPKPVDSYAPEYGTLNLKKYLQLIDDHNPAHRLWSDGRWNKITLAHGCYWKKCAFCDIHLDYISRYQPAPILRIVDAMERLIEQTGTSGFHLVDEAAPPKLLKDLALEILRRGITCSWWGNIRFEKAFTPDLCRLLAHAGMIAATGGLEVANDRLLAKMNKGVTLEQAVHSAQAFEEAGIMVHAYLMYGFPSQTEEETLEAMEYVRQMFSLGLLRSAFWHRFVLTQHSGVYTDPTAYHINVAPKDPNAFAQNDIPHIDIKGGNHDRFDTPLEQSLRNWMRKHHIEQPLQYWFTHKISKPNVSKRFIQKKMYSEAPPISPKNQLLWIGCTPLLSEEGLYFADFGTLALSTQESEWVLELIDAARPTESPLLLKDIQLLPTSMDILDALRPVGLLSL